MRLHWLVALLFLCICGYLFRSHGTPAPVLSVRMRALPRITIWSWQRREDLRALDPRTTAVGALAGTLIQDGPILHVMPQHNALLLPASMTRIAVVRIETHQPLKTEETATAIAKVLAQVAVAQPRPAVLQIDFDALLSERAWYRIILQKTRAQLPSSMPLSMTALASWCSGDRWLQQLPVDEAVPMLFRMEPGMHGWHNLTINEPLCEGAVGISTHEDWPAHMAGKRIYLFPDGGWLHDDVSQTVKALP